MDTARSGPPDSRVAVVTGGSRGIGLATARRLAARGSAVVVNYLHNQRAAESAVEAILRIGGNAVAVRADAADELDVRRLFAETIAAFGGVDVVVHAAGGRLPGAGAALIVNREAARHLRDGGAIVTVCGSTPGAPPVLTRALALELRARDIVVNAVSPAAAGRCAPDRVAVVIERVVCDGDRPGAWPDGVTVARLLQALEPV